MKVRHILSFGAGVNSGAMMSYLRLKGIKIDEALMADPEAEDRRTYQWIEREARPYFRRNRIKFTIVRNEELGPMYDYYFERKIIPCVSKRECTDKWKIRPIKNYIAKKYQGDVVFCYIGYDSDEPQRPYWAYHKKIKKTGEIKAKSTNLPYIPVYPLIQHNTLRNRCKKLIQALDLRIPVKSRCFCCPNRKESGFYDLWKHERDNFEKAMALEENCSRFNDTRSKVPFCLLADRRKTLRKLKTKFEEQSKLVMYFQIPCMMLEYNPIKKSPKISAN